jgi:L-malate glycosyltransferase
MACEVPILSSEPGGIPKLKINGSTGYVCSIGDIKERTEKVLKILDDQNLLAFKERAFARAKEYDVTRFCLFTSSFILIQ